MNPTSRLFRIACFALGGIASFSVSFYFYYFYFFMQDRFGFSGKENLAFAALNGFIYMVSSWQAGRFAQRRGYINALLLGVILMLFALGAGSQLSSLDSAAGLVLATMILTLGMCFLWPSIEALVSEGQDRTGLTRAVGIYNVVWAGTNALAIFTGGTLVEKFGFGIIFSLPLALLAAQLALTFWLKRRAGDLEWEAHHASPPGPLPNPSRPSPARARAFLRMAWLANPFAYLAINTVIPMLPIVAARFHLSPMFAGFACSLWCFCRLGTFIALWHWTGWHYRFRWLAAACGMLVMSFAAILIVPRLTVLLMAQLFFGASIGLIYYSSLFYSMDVGEAKGEHGGIHEAAIGIGNCIGPAVGAASMHFLPQQGHSSAIAVSLLLLCGLGGLLAVRKTSR